jgi:RNA-directed DNA polymerase
MQLRNAQDLTDLSVLLNCTAKQLGYYIYKRPLATQYKSFVISKRRGGTRTIFSPTTNLKLIQRNIARILSELREFKTCVNGFVEGRDIKRNAVPHVSQRFVLNIDLEDFFGSITFPRVYGLLLKPPYSIPKKAAAGIAKLCTLEGVGLPQGAPSSPIISNLICAKMDAELTKFANARGCRYTRYADDLTFSTTRQTMPLASNQIVEDGTVVCLLDKGLRKIIEEDSGFRINENKSRLRQRGTRQEVTGLIVTERVNVKRRKVRQVRAMLHAWRKFGLSDAQAAFAAEYGRRSNFVSALRGRIEFIGQIRDRPDAVFKKLAVQFNALVQTDSIRTELTREEIAKQATWVIENSEKEQGTAFFTAEYGLVTCAHCVGPNLKIYHPAYPTKRFSVEATASDTHRDLAILGVPKELEGVVPIPFYQGKPLVDGDEVVLLGYPNHQLARPIRIEYGRLIRTFPNSAVLYLEVSPKIIEGNSGGPLLDKNFQVIGVAARGLNASTDLQHAEFFAVSAGELRTWLGR